MKSLTLVAGALVLSAAPAIAQPNCNQVWCVKDHDGKGVVIGEWKGDGIVVRVYGGVAYQFDLWQTGFPTAHAMFWFVAGCGGKGTPFLEMTNTLSTPAYLDENKVLWAPQPPYSTISPVQYQYDGACNSIQPGSKRFVGAAEVLDATTPKTWVPPFRPVPPGTSSTIASR